MSWFRNPVTSPGPVSNPYGFRNPVQAPRIQQPKRAVSPVSHSGYTFHHPANQPPAVPVPSQKPKGNDWFRNPIDNPFGFRNPLNDPPAPANPGGGGGIAPTAPPQQQTRITYRDPERNYREQARAAFGNAGQPAPAWTWEGNPDMKSAADARGQAMVDARAQAGGPFILSRDQLPAIADQSKADYWNGADMQAWAKANPKLAEAAMKRAGYDPNVQQPTGASASPFDLSVDYTNAYTSPAVTPVAGLTPEQLSRTGNFDASKTGLPAGVDPYKMDRVMNLPADFSTSQYQAPAVDQLVGPYSPRGLAANEQAAQSQFGGVTPELSSGFTGTAVSPELTRGQAFGGSADRAISDELKRRMTNPVNFR